MFGSDNEINNENEKEEHVKICQICLTEFTKEEIQLYYLNPKYSTICVLQCKHGFHPECIQNWLLTRVKDITSPIKRFKTCPTCRYPNNTCQHPWNSSIHLGSYLFEKFTELEEHNNTIEKQLNETQQRLIALTTSQPREQKMEESEFNDANYLQQLRNNLIPNRTQILNIPRNFSPQPFIASNVMSAIPQVFLYHHARNVTTRHSTNTVTNTVTNTPTNERAD